jgi:hypothetical protein
MSQPEITVEKFRIVAGAVYLYTAGLPVGRQGERYRVLGFPIDVPVNNHKVLVRCLSGPDAGLLFTVTPINFSRRYVLHEPAGVPVPMVPVA